MALSAKQQAFIEHYLRCFNASEAARLAGYSPKTAYSIGHENLKKPEIAQAIADHLAEMAMGREEALARLAEQGRNLASQYFKTREITVDGKSYAMPYFDFEQCIADGNAHLIKKLKFDSNGNPEIELYDAQAALVHIGKHLGLFVDRVENTGANGGPIEGRVTLDLSNLSDSQLDRLLSNLEE